MSRITAPLLLLVVLAPCPALAGEDKQELPTLMTQRGKLLFSEDFSQPLSKDWVAGKGKWEIVDGAVRGNEVAADMHGAVKRHPLSFHNAVIQYSFKLDGNKTTSFSINAVKGHACRVRIDSTSFSVNKDADKKAGTKGIVLDTITTPIKEGQWHTLVIEVLGKEMLATVDGKHTALGSHDALNVPFANFGLTVAGSSASFKNLRIWDAQPSTTWEATKAKILQDRVKK